MRKFIVFWGVLLGCSVRAFAGGVPADIYLSVGSVAAGDCDYTSIQQAIDSNPVIPIHVVNETFNENLSIIDQTAEILGGFESCGAAEAGAAVAPDQLTTLIPASGPNALISADLMGTEQEVTFTRFAFTNGENQGFIPSGGITVVGNVTLNLYWSELTQNTGFYGGALYVGNQAGLYTRDTVITNNQALAGGGIYCDDCSMILDRGTGVHHNTAIGDEVAEIDGSGGGLYLGNGAQAMLLNGSKNHNMDELGIHANQAALNGGGIYLAESTITLYGDDFFGFGDITNPVNITANHAGQSGGGLYAEYEAGVQATAVKVSDNSAGYSGAGMEILYSSELQILAEDLFLREGCWTADQARCNQFTGNHIVAKEAGPTYGGAIKSAASDLSIENTWFEQNNAGGEGDGRGSVLLSEGDEVFMRNVIMFHNGAVQMMDQSLLDFFVSDVYLTFMTAVDNDSGQALIRAYDSSLDQFEIHNSIIHNNNDTDVLKLLGMDAFYSFNCLIVHEVASFAGLGSAIAVNQTDPQFMNRAGGNLNLYSASSEAVDQCSQIGLIDYAYDSQLAHRFIDVPGMGEDGEGNNFLFDVGAIEYQGDDQILDVIFKDGLEGFF